MWWVKLLVYGHIGMLIEVWFTGIRAALSKNPRLTGLTYLWMVPIYGITALVLEIVGEQTPNWYFWVRAILYTLTIYVSESLWGSFLRLTIGHIPWDYGRSRWTPFGLVNFKYAVYWYALACVFDPLSAMMHRVLAAGINVF